MSSKSGAVWAPGQRPFPLLLGEAGVFPANSFLQIPRHGCRSGELRGDLFHFATRQSKVLPARLRESRCEQPLAAATCLAQHLRWTFCSC